MPSARTIFCLVAAVVAADSPADKTKYRDEALRTFYRSTATKYEFYHAGDKAQPLKLIEKPVMKWTNEGDWSGDVFIWTHAERPEVIGCVLTGPGDNKQRLVFNEFHLLAEEPISAGGMEGRFRWSPREGLKLHALEGAPDPAETPALRLAQMRQNLRDFSAHMHAESDWELRLLPQPLLRYQPKEGPVVDGALFTFVWTKGTDPELVLLLECRKTADGLAWFYAPVRFSNRELWLKLHDHEVWRGPFHSEPAAESTGIYTTRYLTTISDPQPE